MWKKILLFMLQFLLVMTVIQQGGVDKTKIADLILERPDIVVEKMKLTKQPTQKRGKIRLKIEAWLSNKSSKSTSCCPTETGKHIWNQNPAENQLFRVEVFAKYKGGTYFKIGGTSDLMQASEQNERYQFTREFDLKFLPVNIKVVGDSGNWISEKNESNNMKRMYWPLRSKKVMPYRK